jgi:glycosyltransferase involved in cell wall biosynthesis
MLLENNPYELDVRVRSEAESLARAGYQVTVVAPRARGWRPRRRMIGEVHVEEFRLPESGGGAAGFVLEYLVAAVQLHLRGLRHLLGGAQVVHLHNPPDILFGVALAARALGRQVVFDHHDLAPEMVEAKFGTRRLRPVMIALERVTFRCCSVVLAANETHRSVAIERGRIAPENVTVVRNGPPAAAFRAHTPGRTGVLRDPVIVFVGEMAAQDGVHELPVMLDALVRRHGLAAARLLMIGRGPERDALEARLHELGLNGQATFTGQVPHADVFALVASADICVDPSPPTDYNNRSTMIKIAEYLAVGRPIVTHALTETRRTAGDAALYIDEPGGEPLADAVAQLATDPERREAMISRGRERAADLGWDASERALLGVYRVLIAASSM